STLLFLKGISKNFNDIDIMVSEEDVEQLKILLLELGTLEPVNPHKSFKTKRFLEFKIDEVEVDVIAGFIIISDNKEYYFPLEKNHELEEIEFDGIKIPLQSLREWKKIYKLMGRIDKVEMINTYDSI
ncbi:MAG: hypothetical protein RBR75_00640, partial [Acholeplasmataceae bacterium]|nr:hypothetical protein [Acholeplasmataceae bacterium]